MILFWILALYVIFNCILTIPPVRPVITLQERLGGEVPSKAVDWALSQCERFIRFKTHEDLDIKVSIITSIEA